MKEIALVFIRLMGLKMQIWEWDLVYIVYDSRTLILVIGIDLFVFDRTGDHSEVDNVLKSSCIGPI